MNPREFLKGEPKGIFTYTLSLKCQKLKIKRVLWAAREKQLDTYKVKPVRLTADFSAETLRARWEWHDTLKVMKGKKLQPRLLDRKSVV